MNTIEQTILQLSKNYTKIIPTTELQKHKELYWGGNGVGDRWVNKKYNYSVVYRNKPPKKYSENEEDEIPITTINAFLQEQTLFLHRKPVVYNAVQQSQS